MTSACPNGHSSETSDYCDQCGAKIGGAPPPGAAPPASTAVPSPVGAAPPAPTASPSPTPASAGLAADLTAATSEEACPVCQTPRVGDDRFCEGCGYDFTAPAGTSSSVLAVPPGTTAVAAWIAVATADRDYFDRIAPEGVTFPLHCPARTFLVAGREIRIGRRSSSRGIQPEVDLSGAPEDIAISHLHCLLIEQPDGSYCVVDPGSTNGTTMNDDPTPLSATVAVAVADGDRIHLGAWTTITFHRRPDDTATAP